MSEISDIFEAHKGEEFIAFAKDNLAHRVRCVTLLPIIRAGGVKGKIFRAVNRVVVYM